MITKDLLAVACAQQSTTISGALFVASMRDQLLTELENTPVDFCWWGHSAVDLKWEKEVKPPTE